MDSSGICSWLTVHREEWAPGHFAWPLVDQEGLSVKLEAIPVGGGSNTHRHRRAQQFFFVLEGVAAVDVGRKTVRLTVHEGLRIAPGEWHRIRNVGETPLLFILVSAPRVVSVEERRSPESATDIPGRRRGMGAL